MKYPTNGGKGHDPRPLAISIDEFGDRWELAFGRKKPAAPNPEPTDNDQEKTTTPVSE